MHAQYGQQHPRQKLQTMQNKFLRIALKVPWFMRNTQLHNNTGIPYLTTWINEQFINYLIHYYNTLLLYII